MIWKTAYTLILVLILAVFILPCSSLANSEQVYIVSLKDEITPAMSAYLADQIELAGLSGAKGIIIDISTLGGRVDSAIQMRDAIIESEVPVVVYVGSRATSAGALITIAADTIVMAPGSHMGAAEPVPYSEKAVAFVSGEFRATANARGRDPLIAAGMADKNLNVPGFPKGTLVNITAEEASELGYADAIANNITEVLDFMGWAEAQVLEVEPDAKLRLAQFLTRYDVSSILLTIALAAMVIEVFMQGFGLPGIVSIIAFVLFFSGGFLAGNTEWWSLLLFALGLILLFTEIFIPGFGVAGISGIVSLIIGVIFAAPTPLQGITSLAIALAATAVLIPVLYKLMGGPRLFRRLVLQESETLEKGYVSKDPHAHSELLGFSGKAVTALRPAGTVEIDGKRLDAISDGSFLPVGTKVRVIETKGSQVVVTAVE
jgi:membrane-bound serine protease (ClpP class)